MDTESISNRCPKCQAPLPADAPQGLCPKCLLAAVAMPTEAGQPAGNRPKPPAIEEIAAAFPQLEILEFIGQGGMGFVFKARQPKLDRLVALKILPQSLAADPTFAERFNREARLLARLNHPGIVTVHDFGVATSPAPHSALRAPRFYYLLMEFVDGVNLRQAMQAGRFTPDQALAIVPRICEALQFAHNEGILHRDIKPENILLDAKGRVKIADFGIAKLMGDVAQASQPAGAGDFPVARSGLGEKAYSNTGLESPVNRQTGKSALRADALTEAGKALGTPNYMAPEQLENAGEVDHRADIYSLGVVFYEMLTGELPLGRFAPPSQKSAADPRVDEVVLRALEKEKAKRYSSADEVKTRVETIAGTTDSRRSQTPETQKSDTPVKAMECWFSTTQYVQSFVGGFYPKQGDCELTLFGDRLVLVTAFDRLEIPLSAIHTVRRLRGPVYQNPFLEHFLHLQYEVGGWRKDLVIVPGRKVYYLTGWQEPEVIDWCIAIREAVGANTGRMPEGSIRRPAILHPSPLGTLAVYGVALITVLLSAFLSKLPILMMVCPIAFGLTVGAMLLWGLLNQPSLPVGESGEGSGTLGAPVARRRKEAVTIALLVLLLVATLSVLVLNLQAPRFLDKAVTVSSPIDTPGGQLTASGVTIGAMRVFGRDQYEYHFTIQDSAGVVVRQTELPVPFDNDKLRPDFSIVGGPLPDYYFGTHGRIEWKPDGSAVVFSMRGVELTELQVDRFSGPARPPNFDPVVERVEADAAKSFITGWVPEGARISLELGKGQGWLGGCDFTNATRFTVSLERHADGVRCVIRDAVSKDLFDLAVQVTTGQRVLAQGEFVFDTRHETINAKGPIRLGEWRSKSGEVLPVSVVLQAASEKLARAPIPPRLTFGPVIERVVNDIGERQGSEALQLASGQLLSLPAPARELTARYTWMLANQADLLLDFTANHRLTLAAGIKLADFQAANWETATPVELAKALQTEATGLGHVAGSGAQEYWLTEQPKFPVTLAFQVAGGQRGLLQITGFTENPRGVKIRYKLVQNAKQAAARPAQPANPGRVINQPPFVARLPEGEVELVGVSEFQRCTDPSLGITHEQRAGLEKVWWQPNGSSLNQKVPGITGSLNQRGRDLYEIALRVSGQTNGVPGIEIASITNSAAYPGEISGSTWARRVEDMTFQRILSCEPGLPQVSFRIGVATEPWRTEHLMEFSSGASAGGDAGNVMLSVVASGEETTVTCQYEQRPGWQTRLIAQGSKGEIDPLRQGPFQGVGNNYSETRVFRADDIKEARLHLQRRQYHWVEFHNVSLKPGQQTQVEVVGETATPGQAHRAGESNSEASTNRPSRDYFMMYAWDVSYNLTTNVTSIESRWELLLSAIGKLRDEGLRDYPDDVMIHRELAWLFQHRIGRLQKFVTDTPSGGVTGFRPDGVVETDPDQVYFRYRWLKLVEQAQAKGQMQSLLKLDPALVQEVNAAYGPLDWRMPETHAIYWCYKRLQSAPKLGDEDLKSLQRVLWQSLQLSYEHGTLVGEPASTELHFERNLGLVPAVNAAFEQQIAAEAASSPIVGNIRNAQRNFLRDAIVALYEAERKGEARNWFEYFERASPDRPLIPGDPKSLPGTLTCEEFVKRIKAGDFQSATPRQGDVPLLPSGMSISAAGDRVVVEMPNGTLTADRIEFPGTNLLKATNMRMTVNSNSPPLR